MRVVYSPSHLAHDPETEIAMGAPIPANEGAERAERIRAALDADPAFSRSEPTEHGLGPITDVHDADFVRFLEEAWTEARRQGLPRSSIIPEIFPVEALTADMGAPADRRTASINGRAGLYALDTSTPIVAGTYLAARGAVDVALTAVDLVLGGERAAYGLCRPPGHHAARAMYGGYCYFNNAAIAAEAIVRATGERVSILDVDYHHGNGTQQLFWRREDVLYVSLHADPARQYPFFLGWADETGAGAGAGANLNLPLPAGIDDAGYLAALDRGLERIAAEPGSIVVVSLGMDTYAHDPLGDFALSTAGYASIGARVAALGRRLVILQEGGYHRPSLGANVRAWLRGAAGES